ncbi:hypothetical protein [Neorhizobium alkalisoli]|uniref:Uncharacterized protein n=1 Tax=Neorhizobium alkalisoli TaxID=528178 RepID=A0A561R8U9_9HYPH|nr:hypothetical protein [Neorhizobium alkalisoli]TWF59055.1 hypothetical protein FHW37_101859 [Neorhizobium alkalisoli]
MQSREPLPEKAESTDLAVWPVDGHTFEDILDGYFPLNESVRQMMARHQFIFMRISILHAPVMNIHGLAPTEPVPLYLRKIYAGMIDSMVITAERSVDGMQMSGSGAWMWVDGTEETQHFPASTRLGEPAFVRGIGIRSMKADDNLTSPANVAILRLDGGIAEESAVANALSRLGWSSGRAWPLETDHAGGIKRSTATDAAHRDASGSRLLINTSEDQLDAKTLELSRLV